MGLYDSVMANCPRCGAEFEFQSRAGESMEKFKLNSVPLATALDLARDLDQNKWRCNCGYILKLAIRVEMVVKDDRKFNELSQNEQAQKLAEIRLDSRN